MLISEWSSDVCSSDLGERVVAGERTLAAVEQHVGRVLVHALLHVEALVALLAELAGGVEVALHHVVLAIHWRHALRRLDQDQAVHAVADVHADQRGRSEEPTSELPSLMRISSAVFRSTHNK